ncbi:MAG: efflux RND transporter permease subunit [Rubrivivax sp.]|nr:efflux RND transporter permease subunit [Rubrivivax sp.]
MFLSDFSIKRPVAMIVIIIGLMALGMLALSKLRVNQMPDVEQPLLVVAIPYPGASPDTVEREVINRIEKALQGISGVTDVRSTASEGNAQLLLIFNFDKNMIEAADEVRNAIASVRYKLPVEMREPILRRVDPAAQPIMQLALSSGTMSHAQISRLAEDDLADRFRGINGVAVVNVNGALRRELSVLLRAEKLREFEVSVTEVVAALRAQNATAPVGKVRGTLQDQSIRLVGRIESPVEFGQIVIKRRGSELVRLEQVAVVKDGFAELSSFSVRSGNPNVGIAVTRTREASTVSVANDIRKLVGEINKTLPAGTKLEVTQDGGESANNSLRNVIEALVFGAGLTILVVYVFLNSWRSTLITALSLPTSVIAAFIAVWLCGFTLNFMSLLGLSLAIGVLIDDAIVVRENIVRHVQMGKSAHDAALQGTDEIGMAVLATTLSIVAVFLPIGFMGGIVGKFFHEFGITIVAAVLISMFVSFTLDPMLSSIWNDPAAEHGSHLRDKPVTLYDKTLGRVTALFDRLSETLGRVYQGVLAWSLVHQIKTVLIATATFVVALALLSFSVGKEFMPQADFSETQINFYTPVGSSLEVTEMRARQVDAALRELPEVQHTVTTINSGFSLGKIYGATYVRLLDRKDRQRSMTALVTPMRERLARIPGVTVTNIGVMDLGGSKSIAFSVQGADLGELERLARQITPRLAQIPGLVDLDSSLKPDKPTVAVDVKREAAADLGLNVAALASNLRTLVAGISVGNWRAADGENYDVRLSLAPEHRNSVADLAELPLVVGSHSDGSARVVRLSQVAEVRAATGPNQINRRDLNREIQIDANPLGRSAGEVTTDIRAVLDSIAWPPGYRYSFGGSTKNMQESFSYALGALALAVVFIYMILASQFKSFLQPLALMSALPLTLIGVVGALMAFGSTLNMFSIIGIVMLMGLVTKNAILLIDFAIRAREGVIGPDGVRLAGLDRNAALLEAARVRLRPILMTTLAMIFGMVPLAFALSEGSEQRAPMGQAVIGGVITSSLLTLVVVPVIYCWLDDLALWARRLWRPTGQPAGMNP